jgi:hypothetical protein
LDLLRKPITYPTLAFRNSGVVALCITLLAGLAGVARAQAVPALPLPARAAAPKILVKAGMRLTHLFYLPDGRTWQLVLPSSFGIEYRLQPHLSFYAQAEADIATGRQQRGRRIASPLPLPTPTTDVSLGARYYFNPPTAADAWGNYVALEGTAELSQLAVRGRGRRTRPSARLMPGVFALCGTQHRGPGHRLLYDLNAGLGIEAPPSYAADAAVRPPWDVAAQVNLRVYLVNQPHRSRHTPR